MTDEFITGGQQKVVSANTPSRSNIVTFHPSTTKSSMKIWVVIGTSLRDKRKFIIKACTNQEEAHEIAYKSQFNFVYTESDLEQTDVIEVDLNPFYINKEKLDGSI